MTTIITKNGNGIPPSLEVGELAIDKSEPALYTNTGSSIEKIGGGKSGGGGGFGAITSWPDSSSPDWRSPWNASLFMNSPGTLYDLINITSGSGYLLALELKKRINSTQTIQCKITVDGKVIKDMTGPTDGDDMIIVFWPPTTNALPRITIPFSDGSIPPSFPLRFESSLRVQFRVATGSAATNLGTVLGQYVLT